MNISAIQVIGTSVDVGPPSADLSMVYQPFLSGIHLRRINLYPESYRDRSELCRIYNSAANLETGLLNPFRVPFFTFVSFGLMVNIQIMIKFVEWKKKQIFKNILTKPLNQ
jgi:hypothetical protein